MKQLLNLLVCGLSVLLPLSGCQDFSRNERGVEVIIEGGGEFPEFLVGQWKEDRYRWAITFESDGSISTVVHRILPLPIDLDEGGFYMEFYPKGKIEGINALFMMGPCEADYNPATRELSVKIMMDTYEIKTPAKSLEGRSEDYFVGPVSKDGMTWHADWRGYTYLYGASPPDVNYIDANPKPLVFTKVDSGR